MVSQIVIVTVVEDGGPVDRRPYYYSYGGCEANADVEVAVKMDASIPRKSFDCPRENMYRTYNIR